MILKFIRLGSSAKGHSDNLGIFSNFGYKFDDTTIFLSFKGDRHKYSQENLTYRLNATKLINKFTFSLSGLLELRQLGFVCVAR